MYTTLRYIDASPSMLVLPEPSVIRVKDSRTPSSFPKSLSGHGKLHHPTNAWPQLMGLMEPEAARMMMNMEVEHMSCERVSSRQLHSRWLAAESERQVSKQRFSLCYLDPAGVGSYGIHVSVRGYSEDRLNPWHIIGYS